MNEDPDTHELREAQRRRERAEELQAETSLDEQQAAQHERRAEKARYLKEKLEERARAESDDAAHDAAPETPGPAPPDA